jgi:hypothetical protein
MARKARTLLAVAIGSLVVLGCSSEDARLKDLSEGITKDSAMAVLGVRAGERPAAYLVKGKMIEATMIRRPGVEGPLDSLTRKQYSPVVIIDGKLAGWGWKYWDSVGKEIGLPPQ